MRNSGVRRPGVSMVICAAMALGGAASIVWGVTTMNALGHETNATAAAIGLASLPVTFGTLFFFNFWWAYRLVVRMRRGEGVLGRWRVEPATLELFRSAEASLGERRNDWRQPRRTPHDGLEVIFSPDAVLIGDTFFGLASTGMARFNDARLRGTGPYWLEFSTTLTQLVGEPTVRTYHHRGTLRVPVAADGRTEAVRVLGHFLDVLARRTIVKPHFWRTRIRLGLGAFVLGSLFAATGFALRGSDVPPVEYQVAMAVIGTILALAGLVMAAIAARFRARQHRG